MKKYSSIKLLDKSNGGLSDARNVGIMNATGDYIIFLDSDDYWDKDFLSDLAEMIEDDNELEYIIFRPLIEK